MSAPLDLEPIKTRLEGTTPGPWKLEGWVHVGGEGGYGVAVPREDHFDCPSFTMGHESKADCEFIARARTDVPALIAEVERQRQEITELERALRLAVKAIHA